LAFLISFFSFSSSSSSSSLSWSIAALLDLNAKGKELQDLLVLRIDRLLLGKEAVDFGKQIF
jgi:hypothetical protein